MLKLFKIQKHAATVVALSLVFAGCGTDEDEIVVKNTDTPKTPVVTESPAVAATEIPVATPEAPQKITYEDSERAFLEGRYAEAAEKFARYTETKPENPWGHYMLGLSAWKDGDMATAEAGLKRAIALDPGHVKSHLNLSRVLLDSNRPSEALTVIDTVLVIDPSASDAYRIRGRAYHALGQEEDAVAAYRTAIDLNPQDAWAMNNIAFIRIEQERYEEALPALARAVELRRDVAVFWNNLGMALERTGRFRGAKDAYTNAVQADPSNAKAFANGERVTLVREDVDVTTPDLNALARAFEAEIATWRGESLVRARAGTDETSTDAPSDTTTTREE